MNKKLKLLMDSSEINKKRFGELLFPNQKYPAHALRRVLSGVGTLSTKQYLRLSKLIGITLEDAVAGKNGKAEKGMFSFELGGSLVVYRKDRTEVYLSSSLDVITISHEEDYSLKEYINWISSLVK